MNNSTFYKIVILILVVLNLGTIGFIWFGRRFDDRDRHRGKVSERIERELGLDRRQTREFGVMREAHRRQLFFLRQRDRQLHDRFFAALFQPEPDTAQVNRIADSIASVRKEMEIITFQHFMQLKKVLEPAQQEKFHHVFRQALEKMLPLPDPPPAPPTVPIPERNKR